MTIHYVVLTCPKHLNRRKSVEKTWLTGQSFTFLSNQYGTPEGYDKIPLKYIAYFRDFTNIKHDADWYYFVDDDSHVFPQKLKNHLNELDCASSIAVGYRLNVALDKHKVYGDIASVNLEDVDYLAGGPGFAISRPAMLKLFSYLFAHPNPPWSMHGDVSFGFWFRNTDVKLLYLDEHLYGKENARVRNHNPEQIRRRYAYHYIPPHKQEWLYSLREDDRLLTIHTGQPQIIKSLNKPKRIGISGEIVDAIYKSSILHFMAEQTIDLVISPACLEIIHFLRSIKAVNSIQIDEMADFRIGYGEQGKWSLPIDLDTNYQEHPQGWVIDYICDQALLPRIKKDDWFGLFSYLLPKSVITRYHSIFIGDIKDKEVTATILTELYGLQTYFWNKEKNILENALLAKECFYRLVPSDYQGALLTTLGIPAIIERIDSRPIARGTSHINDGVTNRPQKVKDTFELPMQTICEQNSSFYQVAERVDKFNLEAGKTSLTPSLSICIPTICCADFLKPLVENILPQLRPDEKIYIVDNGNQGVDKMFDPNLVKVMVTENNLGVSKSWNKLIKTAFAECPHIAWALVLNDDIQLAQGQLRKIRQELFFSERTGKWFVAGPYEWSVFAIHQRCIEGVGYFDEEFFQAFREDDDYSYRIDLTDPKRYKIAGKALEPEIKRKRTSTTRRPELNIHHKNRAYYIKKWGGDPGQEIYKVPFDSCTSITKP